MKTFVALLRGINVGGRNVLPMKALVSLLEDLGCGNVKTYIQSGNVVFQSANRDARDLSKRITLRIKKDYCFEPHVLILQKDELEQAIKRNPFSEAIADPKSLHVGFLDDSPKNPNLDKMEALKADNERFALRGSVFYLHAPDGVGRSKLAASSEKLLGVAMTDRNWRTVTKILEMLSSVD